MKKSFLQILLAGATLLSGSALHSYAQDAQGLYSLEEVTPGGSKFLSNYYPQYLPRLQWIGDYCTYQEGNQIMGISLQDKTPKAIFSLQDLGTILPNEGINDHMYNGRFPYYFPLAEHPSQIAVQTWKTIYIIDVPTKKVVRSLSLQTGERSANELLELSPTAEWMIARSESGELFVQQLLPSEKKQETLRYTIAQNEEDKIVYGEAVHQREFGIEKGIFWSPDGTKIAFYRMDQSMVAPYPIVDITPHKAEQRPVRYPMAGEPSHHVTLGVFDLKTQRTTYMQTGGDPEHYLTNITWAPDSKSLFIAEVSRSQSHNEVNRYDVRTGARLATLFVEEDAKYIEPQSPMLFHPSNDGRYLWLSRKDGYNHLYLGSIHHPGLQQITQGAWEVTAFKGFSKDGKTIFFEATAASPLETRLYSIGLNGKGFTDLTPIEGVHHTSFNASMTAFIDTYSSPSVPRISRLVNTKGKEIKQLLKAENPTAKAKMPEISLGTLTAHDGKTTLYYRLLKPVNFDPNKKYPTIVYVYGGPHAQLVTKDWLAGAGGWDVYMAQRGYVVFTLDNRGSANRGRDFEQAIHRQVGTVEMDDQMRGIEFLQEQSWVDRDRIGVYGWSFGGFMTTNLMLTHGDVFKVGVAGGPVIDWSRYEVMYGERYNDSPQENPEGYKRNNLALRAGDLKGRLLLIHGTVDNVVLWQHAQAFVEACITLRSYPDCMFYPGHEHNVHGRDRVHLNQTIARYFEDHL